VPHYSLSKQYTDFAFDLTSASRNNKQHTCSLATSSILETSTSDPHHIKKVFCLLRIFYTYNSNAVVLR
jgi:hypothetical protein